MDMYICPLSLLVLDESRAWYFRAWSRNIEGGW